MDEKKDLSVSSAENGDIAAEEISEAMKRLEINEAIHDLDAKLTDLEMALNIGNNR